MRRKLQHRQRHHVDKRRDPGTGNCILSVERAPSCYNNGEGASTLSSDSVSDRHERSRIHNNFTIVAAASLSSASRIFHPGGDSPKLEQSAVIECRVPCPPNLLVLEIISC